MVENEPSVEEDHSTLLTVPGYVEVTGGNNIKMASSTVTTEESDEETTEYIEVGVSTDKRFNVLVAGGNGSGKTTFSDATLRRYFRNLVLRATNGSTSVIEERGRCEKRQGSTRIIFTIVDTPGFGDSLNNNDRIEPVLNYIEEQNQKYEDSELYRFPNHQQDDTRIHCCFYFFLPHRVTPLDCEFLKRLQSKVPIVPIVAKRDTLKTRELELQLYNIHKSLTEQSIRIFDFAERNIDASWLEDFDAEDNPYARVGEALLAEGADAGAHQRAEQQAERLQASRRIPNVFAVISGQREYPWGVADENNPEHSDTPRLHDVLFKNRSLQSLGRLQDRANEIHEAWRSEQRRLKADEDARKEEEEKRRIKVEEEARKEEEKRRRIKAVNDAREEEDEKKRLLEEERQQQLALQAQSRARLLRLGYAASVMLVYLAMWSLRCTWIESMDEYGFFVNRLVPLAFELAFFLYVIFVVLTNGK